MSLLRMSSPIWGNLELMMATTAAYTWVKMGEAAWAWSVDLARRPLRRHNHDHQWFVKEDWNRWVQRNCWGSLPAPHYVLLQKLLNDVGDVGNVDFVDQTIDGLLKGFPAHSLILQTVDIKQRIFYIQLNILKFKAACSSACKMLMARWRAAIFSPNSLPLFALESNLWCSLSTSYHPVSGLKRTTRLHFSCYRYLFPALRDASIFPGWWPPFLCMRNRIDSLLNPCGCISCHI